ncbi:vWA domain-containing protein [Litorilituus lipolyticus]|uniref:VWA domain-containing protein n=1 Tax=Litorilituus lipolyticus TaxID=2491017 RepID=A0A502L654_9GAMM|nr:VWA domain-containing protein [Litorilituus lipolyticus]TPH17935.1 VWA domain-containing protein [Litorilituus lipolyticus]
MTFDFNQFIEHFHFVRPWWLITFSVLLLIIYVLKKQRHFNSPWQQLLPKHLANVVLETSDNNATNKQRFFAFSSPIVKPLIIGTCVIFALAGPAWQKLPQPVYQLERGSVLIMDMSYSMYATDIKPNRLTRARFKAIDLLNTLNEGEIGLIAYAGDAFTISPLTQDIKNIELLLPSLSPEIMPVLGANAFAALSMAHETLINAGHVTGDIYWFTDDIDNEEMSDVFDWAKTYGHRVNILGIGTPNGAPIKLNSGELLKDRSGAIVVPKLPEGKLASIAKRAQGKYSTITHGDEDIRLLVQQAKNNDTDNRTQDKKEQHLQQGDQYYEQGPWLLIIILPLVLSYFRRGVLLSLAPIVPLFLISSVLNSQNALANNSAAEQAIQTTPQVVTDSATASTHQPESKVKTLWNNLWQTPDQQGQKHFEQQQYQQAANQFDNTQWQGSAHYKAGNYPKALEAFKQSESSDALYNQGNALAQMQQFDQAIDAYKKALAKDPTLTDAKENIEKIEELKKQQEQQQQQQGEQQQGEQQQSEQQQSEQQQSEQQQGEQQQSEQQQSEQQQSEQQQSEQQQSEQQQSEQLQGEVSDEDSESPANEKAATSKLLDKQAKETEQKHQQLLNKVTDDPYLLLRNKMKLEYQKRQQGGSRKGAEKQW